MGLLHKKTRVTLKLHKNNGDNMKVTEKQPG